MHVVKNLQRGPTIFSLPDQDLLVEWGGRDDPSQSDIQDVSDQVWNMPAFQRALRKGIFEVVDATPDELHQMLAPQYAAERQKRLDADEAVLATMEASNSENDYVEAKCLISNESIMVRAGDMQLSPPLAERFADRANEFRAEAIPGVFNAKGEQLVTWVRDTAQANT